jgi:hypothetical protein
LPIIFQILVKKAIDSNYFISEEAEKALSGLCRNMQDTKILPILLNEKNSKSAQIRSQICSSLCSVLVRLKQPKNSGSTIKKSKKVAVGAQFSDTECRVIS